MTFIYRRMDVFRAPLQRHPVSTACTAHLYGNLMNTYGDNGNILMLKYVAEKLGAHVTVDIVSLKDRFDPDAYDIAFFRRRQDYEQTIVSEDLPDKRRPRTLHSWQWRGPGYLWWLSASRPIIHWSFWQKRIEGLGIMGHFIRSTSQQPLYRWYQNP